MDYNSAKTLIKDTFNYPFDEGRYRNFVINLLNDVDEGKGFPYLSGNYIKDSFKGHVSKYRRIGTYIDPKGEKVDVLIVHLKNQWSLERSRTMLRNFAADYLKNRDEKEAALIGYTTDNPDDWRFSFVRMEYKLKETESGKIKVKEELTPAKRYSYLVGKNEPNHTAQAQLVGILENDRKNPTLNDIETAFSVDAVTKQFYKDYRSQFEKLWNELNDIVAKDPKIAEEFESKTIDTANFAKKLMGQIVFLYFLQKKGWLGVGKDENGNFKDWGTGPKNFLHRLFKKEFTDYGNFFNDVLEPFFYEALASERHNDIYSQFNCKIPFLNGGLFEPLNDYNWEETDILIDNDLIADVFKTFDQYNFTVREDEPLEKEVAVDPEMLGKVFENLLPENLRKGKGAYYTPRTIVHYMCQESLINYLDTTINSPLERGETSQEVSGCVVPKEDIEILIRKGEEVLEYEKLRLEKTGENENYIGVYKKKKIKSINENGQAKENVRTLDDALANIKVCDPAIGSGAFPVGMLNEIVKARNVLSLYLDMESINCVDGASTQTMQSKKDRTIYNFKRHCIQNSLYGVDIDPGAIEIAKLRLWLSLVVDEDDYKEIQALPNLDYKIMQGNSLIEEFHGISLDIKKKNEQEDLFAGGSSLDKLIDDLHQKQADFFNAEHPREKKKKRDAVESAITNIFHHELEKKKNISPQEAHAIETDLKEMTHGNRERNFFPWKLYFADVFREKGGFDVVIANPPYIRVHKQDSITKEIIKKNYFSPFKDFDIYIVFFELGLSINRNGGNVVYITPDKYLVREYGKKIRQIMFENRIIELFDVSRAKDIFGAATYPLITVISKNRIDKNLITVKFAKSIKNIYADFDQIQIAQDTCSDNGIIELIPPELSKILKKIYSRGLPLSNIIRKKQIFCGTPRAKDYHNWKNYVVTDKINRNTLRMLVCSNLKPYSINHNKKVRTVGLSITKPYFHNKDDIISKKKWQNFSFTPKILIRGNDTRISAVLDTVGSVFVGIYGIKIEGEIESKGSYLLALLNSKLYQWIFLVQNPSIKIGGDYFSINSPHILRLPFCDTKNNEEKKISNLVDQILTAKKANPKADTSAPEAEIDRLVYELYGLTEEEIQIVEESVG